MSSVGLFAVGTGVTLIVVAALALLVWGAVMDGQIEDEQKQASQAASLPAKQEQVPALHAVDAA